MSHKSDKISIEIWGEIFSEKKLKIVFFEDDFSKTSKNGGQDLRPFLEIILIPKQ